MVMSGLSTWWGVLVASGYLACGAWQLCRVTGGSYDGRCGLIRLLVEIALLNFAHGFAWGWILG